MYSMMYTRFRRTPAVAVVIGRVLLILLNHPALVSSQGATLNILSERTDKPKEGDSVTLECRVTSSSPPDVIIWQKTTSGTVTQFVDGMGLTPNADERFSFDPITLVNPTGAVYSQRLTIEAVRESDEGSYGCGAANATLASEVLIVYPVDEFPVCSPYGRATVMNGSVLSCKTVQDSKFPLVTIPGMPSSPLNWTTGKNMMNQIAGTELTYTILTSDNGTTFTCFALFNSGSSNMAFSCDIGPLTVVVTSEEGGGLSSADIAGIVVGSIFVPVIIALHFLCCRCTPRRWVRAKSYLLDIGSSSFGTSGNPRDAPAPDQSNSVELGSPQRDNDDVPPSYESTTGNETVDAPVERDPPATSEHLKTEPDLPLQGMNYVDENETNPGFSEESNSTDPICDNAGVSSIRHDKREDSEGAPQSKKIKRFGINRRGKTDNHTVSDAVVSDATDGNEFKKDPSVIYAKVDKTAKRPPHSADTSGGEKISKKTRRFALNRRSKVGKAASPPKPDPVIVYADVDLPRDQDGVRQASETLTDYAEIKH